MSTHELAELPDGGVVSVTNGTLDWVDESIVESFEDISAFRTRLAEIQS